MKLKYIKWLTIVGVVLWAGGHAAAEQKTEWQVLQTVRLTGTPLDMLVSPDNRWIYLLNDKGQLSIYDTNGRLKDAIDVGQDIDHIKAGPREDLLFLLSRSSGKVELISISMIEDIGTENAPYKGPRDAPITIAVFGDFQ